MDCRSALEDGKAFILKKSFIHEEIIGGWDNSPMPLGVYISVPFCRTKCSYCNFASDVFSSRIFDNYVNCLCAQIHNARRTAEQMGAEIEHDIDSIYLGGGTPTVLDPAQLERIFSAARSEFSLNSEAEITVECAPGTLTDSLIACLLNCGVNRVSLGVQSFVDQEATAVGRQHNRAVVVQDIAHLRAAGITNINIDLIAGLPHQTAESWDFSLQEAIASWAPHVSVYMLEVDQGSRLGRELLAGGKRYHAHFVPDEDATADYYLKACERLESAGVGQYEISNFARAGFESRHNLKYWTRQPYLGFGVDAHSMLRSAVPDLEAIRFASPDSLEQYLEGAPLHRTEVSCSSALEENFFLGLRLTRGISLSEIAAKFGKHVTDNTRAAIADFMETGLMEQQGDWVRLTSRGRLLSNEVFERFILAEEVIT
ncbi:MAG TPA: radical SAM family heme chaperone HemW [Candidatus Aquilonibacter sp.]|nr:radical SAM family heme chaperone HemW [Candidatus Aquilonibacter sp.]